MWLLRSFGTLSAIIKVVVNGEEETTTVGDALAVGVPVRWPGKRRRPDTETAETLKNMWESRNWTDAVVACGDRTFDVHRAVLGAKSPVFSAMFSQTGMREGFSHRISIENADAGVVDALLGFCYTGRVKDACDHKALLLLADQYQIDGLVGECSARIVENWSPATAADTLFTVLPLRERPHFDSFWHELLKRSTEDQSNGKLVIDSLLTKFASGSSKRSRADRGGP